MFRPHEPEPLARSSWGYHGRDGLRRARTEANSPDPGCADRPAARFAPRMARNRRSRYPDGVQAKGSEAFNAHSSSGGGSGLVQSVFRSPARIPAPESQRRVSCAAPPSEKRSTFCGIWLYTTVAVRYLFSRSIQISSGRLHRPRCHHDCLALVGMRLVEGIHPPPHEPAGAADVVMTVERALDHTGLPVFAGTSISDTPSFPERRGDGNPAIRPQPRRVRRRRAYQSPGNPTASAAMEAGSGTSWAVPLLPRLPLTRVRKV